MKIYLKTDNSPYFCNSKYIRPRNAHVRLKHVKSRFSKENLQKKYLDVKKLQQEYISTCKSR